MTSTEGRIADPLAPKVVGVGGGHGLAVTLRAATRYTGALAAVVTVADDGGSSGRLRAVTGLPAMGDIRRCLSSLADPASQLGEILEYRFTGELDGHAYGNLVIAALAGRPGSPPRSPPSRSSSAFRPPSCP